jgi:SAM-dependent methyltransferase
MTSSGLGVERDAALGAVTACQVCGDVGLERFMVFGHQPPVHSLLTAEQLNEPEVTYPLDLLRCRACGLVQLGYVVDPRVAFPPEYPYRSGLTAILREDFRNLAESVMGRFGLGAEDLVVDIGSNDGTLLDAFRARGLRRVLGVEPTATARIAQEQGIPTLNEFFREELAERIVEEQGTARLVTAANVFAHVQALGSMLRGISRLLRDGGLFVSESHYLVDFLQGCQYDTIYHEHLRYYSLGVLVTLLERSGFSVVDAERIPTHGGSIRVYALKGAAAPGARVAELLRMEERLGLQTPAPYEAFRRQALRAKRELAWLLTSLKREGHRIVGVGAPARASMLLNFSRVDADTVDYVVEKAGSLKIGLHLPGSHIPVVDEARLFEEQPAYALILSWHIGDELMRTLRAKGFRGRFILPLPDARVIEPSLG